MWWVYVLIGLVILISIVVGVAIGKNNRRLFDTGLANRARSYDFYLQENTFRTTVPNLDAFLQAFNVNVLAQQGISVSRDASGNRLYMQSTDGNLTASLTALGSVADGIQAYKFAVDRWKGRNGVIYNSARVGANIALTTVEKAFVTLDYNAVVERTYMTNVTTKTSLI